MKHRSEWTTDIPKIIKEAALLKRQGIKYDIKFKGKKCAIRRKK